MSVYRPAEHRFPPSRGRPGFEIHPDGGFVAIGIGPADGQRARRGRWRLEADGRLHIQYDDGGAEVLAIRSLGDEVLRVEAERG